MKKRNESIKTLYLFEYQIFGLYIYFLLIRLKLSRLHGVSHLSLRTYIKHDLLYYCTLTIIIFITVMVYIYIYICHLQFHLPTFSLVFLFPLLSLYYIHFNNLTSYCSLWISTFLRLARSNLFSFGFSTINSTPTLLWTYIFISILPKYSTHPSLAFTYQLCSSSVPFSCPLFIIPTL